MILNFEYKQKVKNMPATIIKNHQSSDRKTAEPVLKPVKNGISTVERKTREMERVPKKFPTPTRQNK